MSSHRQQRYKNDGEDDSSSSWAAQLVRSAQNDSQLQRESSLQALTKSQAAALLHQQQLKESNKNNSELQTSTAVYIKDEAYSWLPASVLRYCNEAKTLVEVAIVLPPEWHAQTVLSIDSTIMELEDRAKYRLTRIVSLLDYPNHELPLQNTDKRSTSTTNNTSKRDMADLTHLHEAAILYNLKERHATQHPYTRVGDIVVAMNPFVWMDHLYRKETRDLYAKNLVWSQVFQTNQGNSDDHLDDLAKMEDDGEDDNSFSKYNKLGHDPHVYETSCLAYRGLLKNEGNQTILVTGESGAGKTETVKIVMQHLATLVPNELKQRRHRHRRDDSIDEHDANMNNNDDNNEMDSTVVKRVLESNPVFEAFGNAKTLRNDNSSRFGKFTQLQFSVPCIQIEASHHNQDINDINAVHHDMETSIRSTHPAHTTPLPLLAGSICQTYLLEKSRVVSHSPGERNYHIFYQLLQAPTKIKRSIWPFLEDTDLESFFYLGDNNEYNLLRRGDSGGCVDNEEWPRTLQALQVFDFQEERLNTLLRALCVVLQLGNIMFVEDPDSDATEEGGTVVFSKEELMKLQDVIGIPASSLEQCMTTRLLKTGYDEVNVRLSPSVAKDSTDALAKEIYARIFDVLVKSINEYTRGHTDGEDDIRGGDFVEDGGDQSFTDGKFGVICLLDIFGFERFEVNRFEQLCINYANEHLQQKYVLDNFRAVQSEYESEGIELFDFGVVDNSDVLDLLENKLGVLISLNEECVRPKGNDESFVYKIKILNKDHDRMIDKKLHHKTEFGIRHFAGAVTYNAAKFVERNMDKLPEDMIRCVSQSSNELISVEFHRMIEEAKVAKMQEAKSPRKRKTMSKSVVQKFCEQLKDLMNNIQHTNTRYIRCIKPNDSMLPKLTDHYTTMRQLECAGLVTAITISRETFPNRLGYDSTRERFLCLLSSKQIAKYEAFGNQKEAMHFMLLYLLHPNLEVQPSRRRNEKSGLKLTFACGNTKVYFRSGALEVLETKRLDYYTHRVILIQNWIRQLQAQERFLRVRTAAIHIQGIIRARLEWHRYQVMKVASIKIAAWIRGRHAVVLVQSMREDKAAVLIQSTWRTMSKAHRLSRMKKAAIVIQRAYRTKEKRDHYSSKLAIAVEEARMDNKLLGLKNEFSQSVASKPKKGVVGRPLNQELLEEVESMFDYLRNEIFVLRQSNSEMKGQLRLVEDEKREFETRAETSEAAATASRLQVTSMTKSMSKLNDVIDEYKHEMSGLKKEQKVFSLQRMEEAASVKIDFDRIISEKDQEIDDLKVRLGSAKKQYELSTFHIQQQASRTEEINITEIMRLKDELRHTQESHHDYLAKLMDVLETTHQAREQETARIANELLVVKEEKNCQIRDLMREIEALRHIKRTGNAPSVATVPIDNKLSEVSLIRRGLERNVSARGQRSQKFMEVSARLSEALVPEHLVAITSARRERGKTISVVEEESIRMKKMIRFLEDLFNLEEVSHEKVDDELLKYIDSYMAALDPNTAIMKMELKTQQLSAENKRLYDQVAAQGRCPRCDARDKRRLNRNRTHRSPTRSMDGSDDGLQL